MFTLFSSSENQHPEAPGKPAWALTGACRRATARNPPPRETRHPAWRAPPGSSARPASVSASGAFCGSFVLTSEPAHGSCLPAGWETHPVKARGRVVGPRRDRLGDSGHPRGRRGASGPGAWRGQGRLGSVRGSQPPGPWDTCSPPAKAPKEAGEEKGQGGRGAQTSEERAGPHGFCMAHSLLLAGSGFC